MYHPAIKIAPRLIFLLAFVNNFRTVVLSHWINLNLWHDELADPQISSSTMMANNNFTTITNPGGRHGGLPGCDSLPLTEGQMKLCLLFFDHMRPLVQGAKLGLSECRWQFRNHHWNCSVLPMDMTTTTPSFSSPQLLQSQTSTRVLRENKNVSVNPTTNKNNNNNPPSSRRRNARNQQHIIQADSLGIRTQTPQKSNQSGGGMMDPDNNKDSRPLRESQSQEYFVHPKPTKKKGRKNLNPVVFEDDNENIVLTTATASTDRIRNQNQPILHLHNDKEEKANWNSILTRGTKEVAFAQAVWSAAVTEAVARSCREGSISSCACGATPRPADLKAEWRWGGCSSNLEYAYKFAQNFVDIREHESTPVDKKAKARVMVNLHNNEAGRRAVLKKTKIACKCHGVSGSCALVTCWHQIPTFREIGDHLKTRYMKATQVKLNKRGRLQVKKSGVPVPSVVDLVYIESSPNYCVQNETLGIYGTSGRVCNRTASSPNSCKDLCCNRGWTTKVAKSEHRCNCKFVWCCNVVCEECRSVQKYDVCN